MLLLLLLLLCETRAPSRVSACDKENHYSFGINILLRAEVNRTKSCQTFRPCPSRVYYLQLLPRPFLKDNRGKTRTSVCPETRAYHVEAKCKLRRSDFRKWSTVIRVGLLFPPFLSFNLASDRVKLAEIGWKLVETTKRTHKTSGQFFFFQFISRCFGFPQSHWNCGRFLVVTCLTCDVRLLNKFIIAHWCLRLKCKFGWKIMNILLCHIGMLRIWCRRTLDSITSYPTQELILTSFLEGRVSR